jgi:hypothetical protein
MEVEDAGRMPNLQIGGGWRTSQPFAASTSEKVTDRFRE